MNQKNKFIVLIVYAFFFAWGEVYAVYNLNLIRFVWHNPNVYFLITDYVFGVILGAFMMVISWQGCKATIKEVKDHENDEKIPN